MGFCSSGNMSKWVDFSMSGADERVWILDDVGGSDERSDVLPSVRTRYSSPRIHIC
jgi:hypothetical protein